MFYDALSGNTVKIILTKKDMSDYSLKSENIRARTAESKRTLTKFLKRFQTESSLFPDLNADRLFLEAFPSDDGGCVMYVSTLGMDTIPKPESGSRTKKLMCAAQDINSTARLCACISKRVSSSSLYRLGGSYCLVVRANITDYSVLMHIMEEYGEVSDDDTDIAYAAEHGRVLCRANAVRVMSALV